MGARHSVRRGSLGVALVLLVGIAGLHSGAPAASPNPQAESTRSVSAATPAHALAGRSSDRPVLSARQSFERVLSRRGQAPALDSVTTSLLVTMLVVGLVLSVQDASRVADRYAILSRGPPIAVRSI